MQPQTSKINFSINFGQDNLGDSPPTFIEGGLYFGTVNSKEKLQEFKANTNGLADDYKVVIVLEANGDAEQIANNLKQFVEKSKSQFQFQELHQFVKIEVQAIGYQSVFITLKIADESKQQQINGFIKFLTVGQPTLFARKSHFDFGFQLGTSIQEIFSSSSPLATILEAFRIFINVDLDKDFPVQLITTYIDFMPQEAKNFMIPLTLFRGIKFETIEGGSKELDQDLLNILSTIMTQDHLVQLRQNFNNGLSQEGNEFFQFLRNNFLAKGDIYVNSPIGAVHLNYCLNDLSKIYME